MICIGKTKCTKSSEKGLFTIFSIVNRARDPVLYNPLNCNIKYMVVIIKAGRRLFPSLTNTLSFFSRSDANRD